MIAAIPTTKTDHTTTIYHFQWTSFVTETWNLEDGDIISCFWMQPASKTNKLFFVDSILAYNPYRSFITKTKRHATIPECAIEGWQWYMYGNWDGFLGCWLTVLGACFSGEVHRRLKSCVILDGAIQRRLLLLLLHLVLTSRASIPQQQRRYFLFFSPVHFLHLFSHSSSFYSFIFFLSHCPFPIFLFPLLFICFSLSLFLCLVCSLAAATTKF